MPFNKLLNKDFVIKNNRFELSPEYLKDSWKFKKITATRLASILNKSKYSSQLKTWCMLVGIYSEPMDETLAKLGNVIEPKIRQYVSQKLNINFKDYVPAEVKWDVFKGKTDPGYEMFGGIPDGEPINQSGLVDYSTGNPMLEIKTTSIDAFVYRTEKGLLHLQKDENGYPLIKEVGKKKRDWFGPNGKMKLPEEYKYQLGLYLYLRKVTKGIFAVCFLTAEDYAHPENFDINTHEVYLQGMSISDLAKFKQEVIDPAKDWYNKYIKTGISPEITESDKKWLKDVELLK